MSITISIIDYEVCRYWGATISSASSPERTSPTLDNAESGNMVEVVSTDFLIHSCSNPACSAHLAWSTSSFGSNCSLARKYPMLVMVGDHPRSLAVDGVRDVEFDIAGLVFGISLLTTIGVIILIIGAVLMVAGMSGR